MVSRISSAIETATYSLQRARARHFLAINRRLQFTPQIKLHPAAILITWCRTDEEGVHSGNQDDWIWRGSNADVAWRNGSCRPV